MLRSLHLIEAENIIAKKKAILVKRPGNKVTFIQVTSFANEGLVVSFSTEGVNDQWPLR